jgi:hypothetical protein
MWAGCSAALLDLPRTSNYFDIIRRIDLYSQGGAFPDPILTPPWKVCKLILVYVPVMATAHIGQKY